MKNTPPKLLDPKEVSDRLNVSLSTGTALIRKKLIRGTNVSLGKRPIWRVEPAELERFIRSRQK